MLTVTEYLSQMTRDMFRLSESQFKPFLMHNFFYFCFDHCVFCPLNYGFRLHICYPQSFLNHINMM